MLTAIAPIVGTARVATALGRIADALELELEIAELEAQSQRSPRIEREPRALILHSSHRHDAP